MEIDPRRLSILLNIHRSGGVLAAAELMHLTASAVSQQILKLEREVGVVVLDRQPHGAVLTPAGRVLAEAAERIESELTDARRALLDLGDEVTGTVTIGAFQTVIRGLLIPLLDTITEELPGVVLVIREIESEEGLAELRTGAIDVLMVEADSPVGRRSPRYMRDLAVLDEAWLIALPPNHPVPSSVHELARSTWLGISDDAAAHRAIGQIFNQFGIDPPLAHEYIDYDVGLAMVAAGMGVTLVPSLALVPSLGWAGSDSESVQTVALPGLGNRQVMARHRHTRTEPRLAVEQVLERLVRQAQHLGDPAEASSGIS